MNIAFDTYKQKLSDCRPALEGLADSLNLEGMKNELERLHAMQEAPGFWDDPEKSQKATVKTRQIETKLERYNKMLSSWDDLMTICQMAEEEDDDSMLEELKEGFAKLEEDIEVCRLETLLTGTYDKNNAIGKEKFDYPHADFNQELFDDIVANFMDEAKAAMDTDDKNVREKRWNEMIEHWHE